MSLKALTSLFRDLHCSVLQRSISAAPGSSVPAWPTSQVSWSPPELWTPLIQFSCLELEPALSPWFLWMGTEWSLNFAWLVVSFTRPDPNSKWWISFLTRPHVCVITMNSADDLDSWLKSIISGSALLRICRMGPWLARSLSRWLYYHALIPVPQVAVRLQWSLTLCLVWIFFVGAKGNSFSWLRMFLLADSAPRAV